MIAFDAPRCVHCRICEAVCSFRWVGAVQLSVSAIQLQRQERYGTVAALVCDQCSESHCTEACPTGALYRQGGVVRFNQEECTACLACVEACPKVHFHEPTGQVIICDLCEGNPLCVKWCPEKVLTIS